MKKVTLKIESGYDLEEIRLRDEVSIGRTPLADVVLEDSGLSRVNTTIFRDGRDILVVDEGSTNGTFINGERVGNSPKILFDGDLITCGSETEIRVEFGEKSVFDNQIIEEEPRRKKAKKEVTEANIAPTVKHYTPDIDVNQEEGEKPWILWVAAGSTALILFFAIIGIVIASYFDGNNGNGKEQAENGNRPKANLNAVIPRRVIDPLGGQKQEELDELIQYWEVQEKEITADQMEDITTDTSENKEKTGLNLNVSLDYWKEQYNRTREKLYGNDPPGRILRKELCCGVPKQKAKIREMQTQQNYELPMDFADLARKRSQGTLIELPMATEYWVLDVGGSSNEKPFTSFEFKTGSTVAPPGSDDYNTLAKLAENFSGTKYDMNNPKHRRQMKIRLLRMFHPRALPILQRLSRAYHAKFERPLRITSLSRSMEYQISLNRINPNSFKVRGAGSLPPHTSGCAFDLSRKFQSAEEQNFMSNMLADMENEKILDGLREGNANACFHVFIYNDGKPPAGFAARNFIDSVTPHSYWLAVLRY